MEVFYAGRGAGKRQLIKAAKASIFIEAAKKVSAHIPVGTTAVFQCPICGYTGAYCTVERVTYDTHASCGKCGIQGKYTSEKGRI